jgi:hypothetical protein
MGKRDQISHWRRRRRRRRWCTSKSINFISLVSSPRVEKGVFLLKKAAMSE